MPPKSTRVTGNVRTRTGAEARALAQLPMCQEVAADTCGGNDETQSIANTAPSPSESPGERVLLVACER